MQQQVQSLTQQLQAAKTDTEIKRAELELKSGELQLKNSELQLKGRESEIKAFDAETKRLQAMQSATPVQEVVAEKTAAQGAETPDVTQFDMTPILGVLAQMQEQLAARLGTVREVVSRSLKELEKSGAIRIEDRRIHIKDGDVLRQWTQPYN